MDAILWGLFGGFAMRVFLLLELASVPRPQRPATFSDPLYFLQFLFVPLIGAGLAYAYQSSGTVLSPILAINIGASAPAIFRSLASTIPPVGPRRID